MYRVAERPRGTCPSCRRGLTRVEIAGHAYERCRDCAGIWLERTTLEAMWIEMAPDERLPPLVARSRGHDVRPCPTCGEPMRKVALRTIPLDHCELDGIWFDWPELEVALASAALPADEWHRIFVHRLRAMR